MDSDLLECLVNHMVQGMDVSCYTSPKQTDFENRMGQRCNFFLIPSIHIEQ